MTFSAYHYIRVAVAMYRTRPPQAHKAAFAQWNKSCETLAAVFTGDRPEIFDSARFLSLCDGNPIHATDRDKFNKLV